MGKDLFVMNYRLVLAPLLISFVGLIALMMIGDDGLSYTFSIGVMLFTFGVNQLMGKSVVGDTAIMMHLLPVSAKSTVLTKLAICGVWVGVICSVPTFLLLKNGGEFIDHKMIMGDLNLSHNLFYRGLPLYSYVIKTNPNATDIAISDLMDSGANLLQIGTMFILIPVIFFLIGCYFGGMVIVTHLYLHPLLKKVAALVVSIVGMILGGGIIIGIVMLVNSIMEQGFLSLFAGELMLAIFLGGTTWGLYHTAVKKLEHGYDV